MPRTPLIAATLALALSACVRDPAPPAQSVAADDAPKTFIGRQVDKALAEARRELHAGNLELGDGLDITLNGARISTGRKDGSLPKAEITPQGDLLVAGTAVDVTEAQRQQLLAYRMGLIGIAEAGIRIGGQGADLAGEALSGVAGAIFGGQQGGQAFEQRMEAEAEKLRVQARQLCSLLPGVLEQQQVLAASLPAFQPYARMTQADVDECLKESAQATDRARDEIRAEIRQGIREGIRSSVRSRSGNEADEAAAATAAESRER
jgi:hypothetical protein